MGKKSIKFDDTEIDELRVQIQESQFQIYEL